MNYTIPYTREQVLERINASRENLPYNRNYLESRTRAKFDEIARLEFPEYLILSAAVDRFRMEMQKVLYTQTAENE
jgi:hypothetical protein